MTLPDEQTLQELRDLAQEAEQKCRVMHESAVALEIKCHSLADQHPLPSSAS